MGHSGTLVQKWITDAGISIREASRRSGVSSSTVQRIVAGQVDPGIGTLTEIALACGVRLEVGTGPSADPGAAAAARAILEAGYPPENVEVWAERLPRLAQSDDPVELMTTAAFFASPLLRDSTRLLTGTTSVGRLASAGDGAGRWALSGVAGLELSGFAAAAPPVTILWCEDVRTVAQRLSDAPITATHRPDHATVAVAAASAELFHGSFTHDGVTYAAPIQIALDCLSIPGPVADRALKEIRQW